MKSRSLVLQLSLLIILSTLFCANASAQTNFKSTEVLTDGRVIFRYQDPSATRVSLSLEGAAQPLPMQKDAGGLWTVTTPALAPEIYGYSFDADGQARLDPRNPQVKPNLLYSGNSLTVPGPTPQLWEAQDVPHGVVHHHFYTSTVVQGLPHGQSDYFVYTPPGYDPKKSRKYPVLYLLHGWSDLANGWIEVGQANFIFDNLIAAGKMTPMLVVMPLGYGDMQFVLGGDRGWDDDEVVHRNVTLFSQALLTEIVPRVESAYRASKKPAGRALAGLSMGGLESLTIGLAHPDQFAWVGGFSAALGHHENAWLPALNAGTAHRQLLWIACGTEEELLAPNRSFVAWLKSQNIPVTAVETPGMHTWMVWRNDLIQFVPLLFRSK